MRRHPLFLVVPLVVAAHACRKEEPLELPALLTTELPFRYPVVPYVQQIHGDVTLQLYVDSLGTVVPESTRIAEHAALAAFDTAALEGAPQLQFRPARRGEHRLGSTFLLPVKFRVPGVPPPPGDTARPRP